MKIDTHLATLLSDFFLDIAKAFFIGTFVAPSLSGVSSFSEIFLVLTRGLLNAILFLFVAWWLAKFKDKKYEPN